MIFTWSPSQSLLILAMYKFTTAEIGLNGGKKVVKSFYTPAAAAVAAVERSTFSLRFLLSLLISFFSLPLLLQSP